MFEVLPESKDMEDNQGTEYGQLQITVSILPMGSLESFPILIHIEVEFVTSHDQENAEQHLTKRKRNQAYQDDWIDTLHL